MNRQLLRALIVLLALIGTGLSASAMAGDKPLEHRNVTLNLAPGDTLKITTYDVPTLTGEFVISPAGTIAFPLLGDIKAAGGTPSDLRKTLTTRLGDGYITNPKITVDVATYRPFYILGQVNKPGEYPFVIGLTVRDAVAKAGGFTYRANEKRVYIRSAGEQTEQAYKLTAGIPVGPGDTLRIGERYF